MATATQYINEYEAQLNEYNRLVDEYNKSLTTFEQSFYNGGPYLGQWGEATIGENFQNTGYYTVNLPDFGITAMKPTEILQGEVRQERREAWTARGQDYLTYTIVRDPRSGQEYTFEPEFVQKGVKVRPYYSQQPDAGTVITRDGQILRFPTVPGDFTATAPTFDVEKYQTLLTEELALERQAIEDAFAKTQAEERARFEAQRVEMERQQAILAAESAAAEKQAQENLAVAQAEAAAAAEERTAKEKQFKDETETLQRNVGARRAGYVRARRMRSRSLLSGA